MVSNVVSTLAYSRTLQTILKSKSSSQNTGFGRRLISVCRVLVATIRNLGHCPCPRCLVPIDQVSQMGNPRDMAQRKRLARVDDVSRRIRVKAARKSIYEGGSSITSILVEDLLHRDSLVPTTVCLLFFSLEIYTDETLTYQNAFSSKLSSFGFNMFDMLVVDLMHEVELGVWRAIFIQLLRILDYTNENLKHELDRR